MTPELEAKLKELYWKLREYSTEHKENAKVWAKSELEEQFFRGKADAYINAATFLRQTAGLQID